MTNSGRMQKECKHFQDGESSLRRMKNQHWSGNVLSDVDSRAKLCVATKQGLGDNQYIGLVGDFRLKPLYSAWGKVSAHSFLCSDRHPVKHECMYYNELTANQI